MRESIGGAFLFYLVIIFIGIYVTILAFAIVYARAFNSKNHIITLLEQNEGYTEEIETYMSKRVSGMAVTDAQCCNLYKSMHSDQECPNVRQITGGCIFEFKSNGMKMYEVTTYMSTDLPILSGIMWPITGETSVIYETNKTTTN